VIFASLVDVSTGDEAAAVVAAEADVDSRPGSALIDGLIERFAGNQTIAEQSVPRYPSRVLGRRHRLPDSAGSSCCAER
jgi:hypothetical protein